MNRIEVKKNSDSETLFFSEKILKNDIKDIKEILFDSINRNNNIFIDFNNLNKTDIFFVQLLCSAHKYAVSKNKIIRITNNLPESLKILLENFGFYRANGCLTDKTEACFWLKGVENE